jgi:hypothetical protein
LDTIHQLLLLELITAMRRKPYLLLSTVGLLVQLMACSSKPAALDRLYSAKTLQTDLSDITADSSITREESGKFISYYTVTQLKRGDKEMQGRTYRQLIAYAQTLPADSFNVDTNSLPPGSFTPPPPIE